MITAGGFVYLVIAREANHLVTLCHWCVRVSHREPAEDSNCVTLHPTSPDQPQPSIQVGDILLLAVSSFFLLFTLHPEPPEPAQSSGFLMILTLNQWNTLTRQTLFTISSDSSIILTLEYRAIDQWVILANSKSSMPRLRAPSFSISQSLDKNVCCPWLGHGCWNLNPGSHACVASTEPTMLPSQPHFLSLWR